MIPSLLFGTLFARHKRLHDLRHYTGILSLQALARRAVATGDPESVALARAELDPFVSGEVAPFGNFPVYRCGGTGAASLFRFGFLPEAKEILVACADAQLAQPRGEDGIYCRPSERELPLRKIWIDTAFAVCPFLAHLGVALERDDYLDDAVRQILNMHRIFLDPSCGLVHQGKNFNGPGVMSQDHWSRGNGWGLLALAEVVEALPDGHPRRKECEEILVAWLRAALTFQNPEGLWYQEMTCGRHGETYTETSGSGLILFALSSAIRLGLLSEAEPALRRGMKGLLDYVTPEGAVFHTCFSCCCPGDGSIAAFLQRPPVKDDPHAFGAVLMALAGFEQLAVSPAT
jgi:unsaturated rhamnogalacturonyl hydrolase